jgi:AraC-like DNA-binding protein
MLRPNLLETPEWAIQSFENLTGLRLVVHDLHGGLWPFLHPERLEHRAPCCVAVKARHDWACVDFEVTRLREEIAQWPDGRCHCCHAGFMEWVLPAFIDDRLAWIFFAGQRRPEGEYEYLVRDIRKLTPSFRHRALPDLIPEPHALAILEALRQLRSRLLDWREQADSFLKGGPHSEGLSAGQMVDRRLMIQGFLHRNHKRAPRLTELARFLGIGESRTSHLVQELFGCSYVELLNQERLRTASSLLRESSLTVIEVCLASGFQDISHFHRCFRKRFATTPFKYRRLSRT